MDDEKTNVQDEQINENIVDDTIIDGEDEEEIAASKKRIKKLQELFDRLMESGRVFGKKNTLVPLETSEQKRELEYTEGTNLGEVRIQHIGMCKVEVRSKEGAVPHCHVISRDRKFRSCICLHTPQYFQHKGHIDKFTSKKQRKTFANFMSEKINQPSSKYDGMIRWCAARQAWIDNNPDSTALMMDVTCMPDYENGLRKHDVCHEVKKG